MSKFIIGLKMHLREGLSKPDFYGDVVYKFKKQTDGGQNIFLFSLEKS